MSMIGDHQSVNADDLPNIRLFRDLIKRIPAIKNGKAVIAGGAVVRALDGRPVDVPKTVLDNLINRVPIRHPNDIDVWVADAETFYEIDQTLRPCSMIPVVETENANTYLIMVGGIWAKRYLLIQVIRNPSPTVADLFRRFDFSLCEWATDGSVVAYTDDAVMDLKNQTITLKATAIPQYNCISRLSKYMQAGYTPTIETLRTLRNIPANALTISALRWEYSYDI